MASLYPAFALAASMFFASAPSAVHAAVDKSINAGNLAEKSATVSHAYITDSTPSGKHKGQYEQYTCTTRPRGDIYQRTTILSPREWMEFSEANGQILFRLISGDDEAAVLFERNDKGIKDIKSRICKATDSFRCSLDEPVNDKTRKRMEPKIKLLIDTVAEAATDTYDTCRRTIEEEIGPDYPVGFEEPSTTNLPALQH